MLLTNVRSIDGRVVGGAILLGTAGIRDSGVWRNESAPLSLLFVIVVVVGVKIATAKKSAMAIAAGLILVVIFVVIRFLQSVRFTCSFGRFWPAWQKKW